MASKHSGVEHVLLSLMYNYTFQHLSVLCTLTVMHLASHGLYDKAKDGFVKSGY